MVKIRYGEGLKIPESTVKMVKIRYGEGLKIPESKEIIKTRERIRSLLPVILDSKTFKIEIEKGTILEFLRTIYKDLYDIYGNFSFLGGDCKESIGGHQLYFKKGELENAGILKVQSIFKGDITGITYDTGFDYKKYSTEKPKERYKFYLSLDLSTPEKEKMAKEFIISLINKCKQRKISIKSKTFVHKYDSFNIYTWQPSEIEEILKELYSIYLRHGIFLDTYHFLQKPIEGISPYHIGKVQEPILKCGFPSHSSRMNRLGDLIDQGNNYKIACKEVKVKPEEPWFLDI